jgi:hypothetical protein
VSELGESSFAFKTGITDDIAYTYSNGLGRALKERFKVGSADAEAYPTFAAVLGKLGVCDLTTFVFMWLVKKNIMKYPGSTYVETKFKLGTEDVKTLCECLFTFVDDDFGLQAAYRQNKFTDPKITRLSIHILSFGLSKLAILPWRIGNEALEYGIVTANTPKYVPAFRFLMQCAYYAEEHQGNKEYAKERLENIKNEYRVPEEIINCAVGFVRKVVLGNELLPEFESILAKPSIRMNKQDVIWGFGTKDSAYKGFFTGQPLTFVYGINDDGTKNSKEATVQELVQSGIKICYQDTGGKVFSEVVKFGQCKEKLMASALDPDRYNHLPAGIFYFRFICMYKVRTKNNGVYRRC